MFLIKYLFVVGISTYLNVHNVDGGHDTRILGPSHNIKVDDPSGR